MQRDGRDGQPRLWRRRTRPARAPPGKGQPRPIAERSGAERPARLACLTLAQARSMEGPAANALATTQSSMEVRQGPQPPSVSCWRKAANAFFWARCTDMQLISSRSAAARSDKPSRTVSLRAVAWAAGS